MHYAVLSKLKGRMMCAAIDSSKSTLRLRWEKQRNRRERVKTKKLSQRQKLLARRCQRQPGESKDPVELSVVSCHLPQFVLSFVLCSTQIRESERERERETNGEGYRSIQTGMRCQTIVNRHSTLSAKLSKHRSIPIARVCA